jgi:hypothetical protein
MTKILLPSLPIRSLFPNCFQPLPEILKPDTSQKLNNHIALIEDSLFNHLKYKQQLLSSAVAINDGGSSEVLPTVEQFYEDQLPIYEKYPPNKKCKYMATYIVDPTK